MTGLAQALTQLAELLPERFDRLEDMATLHVWLEHGGWRPVLKADGTAAVSGLMHLEYGLREECGTREWDWRICCHASFMEPPYWASIFPSPNTPNFEADADSPALALSLALVAALKAQP